MVLLFCIHAKCQAGCFVYNKQKREKNEEGVGVCFKELVVGEVW